MLAKTTPAEQQEERHFYVNDEIVAIKEEEEKEEEVEATAIIGNWTDTQCGLFIANLDGSNFLSCSLAALSTSSSYSLGHLQSASTRFSYQQ